MQHTDRNLIFVNFEDCGFGLKLDLGLLVVGSVHWDRLKLGFGILPLIELIDLNNFEMRQSEDYLWFLKKANNH